MKYKFFFFSILFFTFILRFYKLGENPIALDWDEASLAYNAYSILKTGKDEYGNYFPISIRSFSDYKPPLYTYLSVPIISLFGLNEYSTRFLSAFLGFLSVILAYFLFQELFALRKRWSLYFFILFSISPWHLQFSRTAFEANIGLFFFILSTYLFIKSLNSKKLYLLSYISFGISLYSYHSLRLIVPIFIFGLIYIYRKKINLYQTVLGIIFFLLIIFPIFREIKTSTSARLGSVTVLNPNEKLNESIEMIETDMENNDLLGKLMHNRRIIFAREIIGGYLDHFNFDFLFLYGDPPGRHHATDQGMLYYWDFIFILIGLISIWNYKNFLIVLLWFLLAPLASSLTTGTPHAVRALLFLPTYQIFIVLGIKKFQTIINKYSNSKIFIINSTVILLLTFNFFYYLHMYYIHTPVEYAQWWQYGYKQLVKELSKYSDNQKRIIVTYKYDQPYIYFLFYNKTDPLWYQSVYKVNEIKRAERLFGQYEFRNIDWQKDSQLNNVILVGTAEEIPKDTQGLLGEIKFPDGSVAFRIVSL